jgi:large conductance mechanosensitive channel
MKIFKEFREFAVKGNMFDMAIGIIIGTAFNKIISSLVKDIIMPPFGYLLGKIDLSNFKFILQPELKDAEGHIINELITMNYGIFLQGLLDFIIVAFTIFLVIKAFNRFKRKSEDPSDLEVSTPKDIELLTDIRDLLKESRDKNIS